MAKSGIYKITHLESGRLYVGSAVVLYARRATHFSHLRKGIHANGYLQRAFNKYGEAAFSWEVLEQVEDKSTLLHREQWWIDRLAACDRQKGFNMNPLASSSLGRRISAETVRKNVASGAWCGRGCIPLWEREKLSRERKGNQFAKGKVTAPRKLTEDQVLQIFVRYADGEKQSAIAREFGLIQADVSRIIHRRNYGNVAIHQVIMRAIETLEPNLNRARGEDNWQVKQMRLRRSRNLQPILH